MARFFGWDHGFWRRMGVREFHAWRDAALRIVRPEADPDSWDGGGGDHWDEMRRKRDEWRGR